MGDAGFGHPPDTPSGSPPPTEAPASVVLGCPKCNVVSHVAPDATNWQCVCGARYDLALCPKCARGIHFPESLRGRKLKCPFCKGTFRNPAAMKAEDMAVDLRRHGVRADQAPDPDTRIMTDLSLVDAGGSAIVKGSICTVACYADGIAVMPVGMLQGEEFWPYAKVTSLQVGGPGAIRRNAGMWGFGIGGIAAATAINRLTTKTTINTLVHLTTHTTEYVFLSHKYGVQPLQTSLTPVFTRMRLASTASPPPAPPSVTPGAPALPGTASIADELAKLAQLRDIGVLSDEEFQSAKARLLG